jgi:hypothetical protein
MSPLENPGGSRWPWSRRGFREVSVERWLWGFDWRFTLLLAGYLVGVKGSALAGRAIRFRAGQGLRRGVA